MALGVGRKFLIVRHLLMIVVLRGQNGEGLGIALLFVCTISALLALLGRLARWSSCDCTDDGYVVAGNLVAPLVNIRLWFVVL